MFFVPGADVYPNRKAVYQALSRYSREDFTRKVILESAPPANFLNSNPETSRGDAKINSAIYGHDRIEIDVETDQNGFLVISDSYHPGWRAEVDGIKTKIFRANYIMRAIPIESGRHKIVFTFHTPLKLTFWTVAVGWLILALLITLSLFRKHYGKKVRL